MRFGWQRQTRRRLSHVTRNSGDSTLAPRSHAEAGRQSSHAGEGEDEASEDAELVAQMEARLQSLRRDGESMAERGAFLDALRCWAQALGLTEDPLMVGTLREQMAQVWMLEGKDYNACVCAEAAVSARPRWSEAHLTFGRALMNFGDPARAKAELQQAADLDPHNEEIAADLRRCEVLLRRQASHSAAGAGKRSNRASPKSTDNWADCHHPLVDELYETRSRPWEWRRRHFRELCLRYHPDRAGAASTLDFQYLQAHKDWYLG